MRAQQQVRVATGRAVAQGLAAVSLERTVEIRAAYATATAGIISGGQTAAARLALAYIAAYVPLRQPVDVHGALEQTLTTVESPSAIVGLLRAWHLVDEGREEVEARAEAGSYAANLATGDVMAAEAAGLDEGARAAEREPRWAKVANADACEWCQAVAGPARYHSAESVPFHNGCSCGKSPEW